jgi:penicillin-binding protein 1A
MALGTVSVSPVELAEAFTPFATLGDRVTPRVVAKVEGADGSVVWQAEEPSRKRVLEPAVAYLVTDALREALVRGTGREVVQSGFRAPAAGKTGTTNDGADAWFVGYTPDAVAAVWVGFDERRPIMARATGGRLAAPVWARTMMRLYQGRKVPQGWGAPANVIEGMVDPASGMLLASGCMPFGGTAYRELFVRGRAPQTVCPSRGQVAVLQPWELPPLPDIEEGMETGVPPEELALEAPVGMPGPADVGTVLLEDGTRVPADAATAAGLPTAADGTAAGAPGADAAGGGVPGASPAPAAPIGYAPSSPRPPATGASPRPAGPPPPIVAAPASPRPSPVQRPPAERPAVERPPAERPPAERPPAADAPPPTEPTPDPGPAPQASPPPSR